MISPKLQKLLRQYFSSQYSRSSASFMPSIAFVARGGDAQFHFQKRQNYRVFSKNVIFYLNFREDYIIMYSVRPFVYCQCTVEYVTGVFSASYILFLERYLISNLAKSAKIAKAYLKDKLGFRGQEVSRNFLLRNSPRRSQEVISRFSP